MICLTVIIKEKEGAKGECNRLQTTSEQNLEGIHWGGGDLEWGSGDKGWQGGSHKAEEYPISICLI